MTFYLEDPVRKLKGYRFKGVVVGIVHKIGGQIRYVVENEDGILHIFRPSQLERIK